MRVVLALLIPVHLAGCAQMPGTFDFLRPAPIKPIADHEARIAVISAWRLSGRVAVQSADQGFSADIRWHQVGSEFEMRIIAPLGRGTFLLSGAPGRVALLTPKGEMFNAADAETLMQDHLGWTIPVSGARYWVLGIPAPDSEARSAVTDDVGRLTDFEQDRWRVSVLDYTRLEDLDLPRRLFLARDDLEVRIVVERWERG